MSDDWFDKTYRSDETSPAELDAKVLKRARRATRRWAVALMVAAAVTVGIALVLALILAMIELDVPPTERPPPPDMRPPATHLPAAEPASGKLPLPLAARHSHPGESTRIRVSPGESPIGARRE